MHPNISQQITKTHPVERLCTLLHVPPLRQPFFVHHWKAIVQVTTSILLFSWTIPASIHQFDRRMVPFCLSLLLLGSLRVVYEALRYKHDTTNNKDSTS